MYINAANDIRSWLRHTDGSWSYWSLKILTGGKMADWIYSDLGMPKMVQIEKSNLNEL